ncbi:MAG: 4-hydroxy-3-methylbut-2-enyl diphosphate reductase [Bacteroidales bacterium]|nr:4-hydroxy-3-methylbut-2-enyl diphosphate reductase [Bacteroidales bacterium]MDT8374494.1 4-hydroxy-3-methylbut-2-enyl diphosphate reductase [Bacteroidales bacterium]
MEVDIEPGSGFCFGVENAVKIAEEALEAGADVYCLGEIVHNDIEVDRLKKLGLVTITYNQFEQLRDCKVLVRAHGEPPSTYEKAKENNITIIDATCPIVHSMQEKIKRVQKVSREEEGQIVIFGKEDHAEVIGLLGAAGEKGILITGRHDIGKIDVTRPVRLFAQTTRSKTEYEVVAEIIRLKLEQEREKHPGNHLKVHNTICRQVSDREPRLREFSRKHDVILFVSGMKSSNGRMLFDVCKKENENSYFVSSPGEIDPGWLRDAKSVGICGATSTPKWLIQEVAGIVKKM